MLATAISISSGCSCSSTPIIELGQGPEPNLPEGPGLRVLFVGNSLTNHEVPALVQAVAGSGGVTLHHHDCILPGANLEDQWVNGPARRYIAQTRWDFVVLQQGPSSLPDSQVDLRKWSIEWAGEARKHNVKPALYMVWPVQGQKNGFELVAQSYRAAAAASEGRVFPAGEAWQEALRLDPSLPLYSTDKLHAMPAGNYLAALIIAHGLTGIEPATVPSKLSLSDGHTFELPEEQARKLRQAAGKVIAGPAKPATPK